MVRLRVNWVRLSIVRVIVQSCLNITVGHTNIWTVTKLLNPHQDDRHNRELHEHQEHLSDCTFIMRLLYKNSY